MKSRVGPVGLCVCVKGRGGSSLQALNHIQHGGSASS